MRSVLAGPFCRRRVARGSIALLALGGDRAVLEDLFPTAVFLKVGFQYLGRGVSVGSSRQSFLFLKCFFPLGGYAWGPVGAVRQVFFRLPCQVLLALVTLPFDLELERALTEHPISNFASMETGPGQPHVCVVYYVL